MTAAGERRCHHDDGVGTTLEDAFRVAQSELVHWVAAETGMSVLDSYQLVSQGVRSPVANVVDTTYMMVAKLPKSLLPGVEPLQGTHHRLRALAASYSAQLENRRAGTRARPPRTVPMPADRSGTSRGGPA